MDFFQTFTDALVAQFGPLAPVIIVGSVGILLIALALPGLLNKARDPFERLHKPVKTDDDDLPRELRGGKEERLKRFSSFLEPQDAEEYSEARKKMIQAGYRSADAVRIYYFSQFVLGLGLLALGWTYYMLTKNPEQPDEISTILMKVLGPGVVGYMAPKYWVTRRQAERQQEVSQGFPDSLDMLLVCVEAGQSLDQAIVRVSQELRSGFPSLAEEYELVALELKAGKDKMNVLRDFGDRSGNDDIRSFVSVLIQSQAYGTSIAEALRVYAAEMRDKRVMRAEEKANKLPTKMTLNTMMLTVPPLLIILVGPSAISIAKAFSQGG